MSLGREGYTATMEVLQRVATHIAQGVDELGPYRLITNGSDLPVFAFATKPDVTNYTVFDVSERLREHGWLVPAYTFPANRQDLSVLRVVVRAGMHKEMADDLLTTLAEKTRRLESLTALLPAAIASTTAAFAH
jgi:glutamate decarboxylase